MHQPLAYCALRYLLLWEQHEKELHASMSTTPNLESLRKSLHYFRVSRTFRGIDNEATANLVLTALLGATDSGDVSPAEAVGQLAVRFTRDFQQNNLSAATKLLWLRHRRPFLVYDARAVAALKDMNYKFDTRSYAEYAEAWISAYKENKDSVLDAVALLPALQPFLASWHLSSASIERLVQKPWFRERVFDIFLWERGK